MDYRIATWYSQSHNKYVMNKKFSDLRFRTLFRNFQPIDWTNFCYIFPFLLPQHDRMSSSPPCINYVHNCTYLLVSIICLYENATLSLFILCISILCISVQFKILFQGRVILHCLLYDKRSIWDRESLPCPHEKW